MTALGFYTRGVGATTTTFGTLPGRYLDIYAGQGAEEGILRMPEAREVASRDVPRHTSDFRERVRAVVEREIAPRARAVDQKAEFPRDGYLALVRNGLYATHVPVRYGGEGASAPAAAVVVEEIARACASTSLVVSVTRLATLPLLAHGRESLREKYLQAVAKDGAIFSFALSEPEAGSDPGAMRTRAVRDEGHFVLAGTKRWITNASEAQYFLVFAVTEPDAPRNRISAFVVERDDPGVSVGAAEDKLGLRGSPTCEVHFDGVRVPAERLVGEPGSGLGIALEALDHSRVSIAAQAVGIAQGALDCAAEYLGVRRQFGRQIGEFQGLRFMVASMAMKLAAARELTYAAAGHSESADESLRFFAAAAKCFASDTAMEVTIDAVQLLGGNGYTREFPVERMMRDAKATQIYEGTNQILRSVIAREVLPERPPTS